MSGLLSAWFLAALLPAAGAVSDGVHAATADDVPLEAALHAALEEEFERQGLVGLAVAVVVGDEIEEFYLGEADREAGTPVGPSTMFRWASISKPLVAVRAVQLSEAEGLDLDEDVRALVSAIHPTCE